MNLLHGDVKTNSHRNCGSRIQDVVHTGHMKLEGPQSLSPVGYVKMADARFLWLRVRLTKCDLKVRTATRAVGHQPSLNLRKKTAQEWIVIASHHHAIERSTIHEPEQSP